MLQLHQVQATLSNLNPRIEKVGKDKTRPAADLKFTANMHNAVLEQISAGLLVSQYMEPDEKGHQGDLVAGNEAMTTLRHKAKPWASTEDWPGYFIGIKVGEFDVREVELDKVTLKSITADCKEGGTVELSFSVGGYPSGEDIGVLYELMGQTVELTLSPPTLGDLAKLREEAKKAKASGGNTGGPDGDDDDGEEEEEGPPTDAQAGRAFPDAIDARGDAPPSTRKRRGEAAVH